MATETQRITGTAAGSATTTVAVYPPGSTFYNTATSQKFMVNGSEQALTGYSVVDPAVKPADYDTLEVIMGWSNETGSASVVATIETSSDGVNWLPHTVSGTAVTAAGVSRLEVTNFQKFIRFSMANGSAGTIDCTADFTYKKKVA